MMIFGLAAGAHGSLHRINKRVSRTRFTYFGGLVSEVWKSCCTEVGSPTTAAYLPLSRVRGLYVPMNAPLLMSPHLGDLLSATVSTSLEWLVPQNVPNPSIAIGKYRFPLAQYAFMASSCCSTFQRVVSHYSRRHRQLCGKSITCVFRNRGLLLGSNFISRSFNFSM